MPQPIPAEIHTEVAHLRGEFVTNWAMVEMSIDFCIVIIYQLVGGKHIEKEIPRMYSRKIKFLRRCFGRLASLDDFAIEGCALLDRADALMDTRHMSIKNLGARHHLPARRRSSEKEIPICLPSAHA